MFGWAFPLPRPSLSGKTSEALTLLPRWSRWPRSTDLKGLYLPNRAGALWEMCNAADCGPPFQTPISLVHVFRHESLSPSLSLHWLLSGLSFSVSKTIREKDCDTENDVSGPRALTV